MWRSAGMAGAVGIEIVLDLLIGGGAGYFLDRKLNTHWIMYLGLFFGLGAAVKALMRVSKAYKRAVEQEDKDAGKTSGSDPAGGGGAGAN
jgi:F0F1-type ATP synthase assembly protein I